MFSAPQDGAEPPVLPVTLALVDAAGPDDFLDLVRGGLTVAMEALPPGSLFGLIGISDCITLVDMSGQRGAAGAWLVLHSGCTDPHSMLDSGTCSPKSADGILVCSSAPARNKDGLSCHV